MRPACRVFFGRFRWCSLGSNHRLQAETPSGSTPTTDAPTKRLVFIQLPNIVLGAVLMNTTPLLHRMLSRSRLVVLSCPGKAVFFLERVPAK
jgi:hypothetical protein